MLLRENFSSLPRYNIPERLARDQAVNIGRDIAEAQRHHALGPARAVWRENHVVEFLEGESGRQARSAGMGVLIPDVDRSRTDPAVAKRFIQPLLVYNLAARYIDQAGCCAHAGELRRADKPAG